MNNDVLHPPTPKRVEQLWERVLSLRQKVDVLVEMGRQNAAWFAEEVLRQRREMGLKD